MIAVLIAILLLGLIFWEILRDPRQVENPFVSAALVWGLGAGMVTWILVLFASLGRPMPLRGIFLVAPVALVAAISLRIRRRKKEKASPPSSPLSRWERGLVVLILFLVVTVIVAALARPLEKYDAIANFGMKAKIIAEESSPSGEAFTDPARPHINRRYPILIPTLEAAISSWGGGVKVIFPLFYVALLALAYGIQRKFVSRPHALLFTLLLAGTPHIASRASGGAATGYADVPFAFFVAASALVTARGGMRDAVLGGCLAGFAFLTKQEATIFIVAAMVALIFGSVSIRRGIPFLGLWIGTAFLVALPWLIIRSGNPALDRGEMAWYMSSLTPDRLGEVLPRIPRFLGQTSLELLAVGRWLLLWPLVIVGAILLGRRFEREVRFLLICFAVHFVLYLVVYLITPHHVTWHVRMSYRRLLMHLLPLGIVLASLACHRAVDFRILLDRLDGKDTPKPA